MFKYMFRYLIQIVNIILIFKIIITRLILIISVFIIIILNISFRKQFLFEEQL